MSRNISHNLSTHFISEIGLIKALANLISSYNVNKSIHFYTNVEGVLSLDNKVETILYRSIQELVQNALKHAKATEINVQAILVDNVLTLSVEDDGVGIEEEKLSKSIGLNTVKQRIKLINGIFELESFPNRGTTIFIKLNIE
ncbi:MAG TPA: ATP-binding protein [Chitinophagaceae bacterium]|nr:ATP-binding protein [Chitinophagaceae bacterium]